MPESISWWNAQGSWLRRDPHQHPTWYVFDDRGLYRPGEEVKLKGWLRRLDPRKGGDVGPIDGKVREVRYTLSDSRGNELVKDTLALNAFGAFDTTITLPDTMNLGRATVMLVVETGSKTNPFNAYGHTLRVEEFRRPEYEVKTRVSEGPHLVGSHAIATVEADYFAGGGLANAQVQWSVASAPGDYRPPGHDAFSFGKQRPWWMFWGGGGEDDEQTHHDLGFEARTDAAGEHHLKMDFVAVHPTQAMSVTAQASVTDVNRQSWTSSTAMVVHPSARYVGLRSDRTFVQAGEVLDIDAIVTSIDGVALSGVDVLVRAARVEYRFERGQWVEAEADPQTCETTSTTDAVRCSLPTTEGGTHRVVAVVVDEQGRANRTEILVWVAGGDLPASRRMGMESVLLIPDREQYAAGQTAKISVSAPWFPAEGLVTVRRSGIVDEKVIHLDGPSTIVEIPIAEAMTPMISVQVDLVGTAPRRDDDGKADSSLPGRPGFARGVVTLKVPPRQRTLDLTLTPEVGEIEPGGSTTIDVRVRDAAGNPVANAEVALVVVDEAVLSLTGYTLADPLEVFYGWRDPDVRDHYLRSHVLLAQPEGLERTEGQGRGGGGFGLIGNEADMAEGDVDEMARFEPETVALAADKRGSAPPSTPIAMRSDFSALAAFSPSVTTSAQGRAVVPVTVPDNLTRYRIMAVAVVGWTRFGHGESSITARLPLMVRPSAPRFLNFGDTMQLPVVLQNQTDAPMTVDVAVRAHNAELTDGAGRRVEVPAHDRVEVRFPSRAASAGTARFQVGATAGRWSDAASFSLPVWTPATSEAFATYGEIDEGSIVQPTLAPPDVFSEFGGLEITTSSTAVQALTDAVLYLASYPFECSEQRASRVLAVAALRDVLQAFEAEDLPTPEQLLTAVERDIDSLRRMQADDGGFSFWGRGWRSWPYLTVHVTHALERAHAKGFSVPSATRARAQDYLRNIEDHFDPKTPVEVRRVIRAYALYVLRLAGSPNPDQAAAVVDETGVEGLPLEALAWLLPTLHDDPSRAAMVATIQRHLDNKVTETASTAHFATAYADGAHLVLHSDRHADALVLEALIATKPGSDLIPKLVRGLLDHRTAGRWSSTQENSFVLLALDRYFQEYEKTTPNFVARAWLGDAYAGEHRFRGRTTERHHIDIPMAWLADHPGGQDLVLAKQGKGRMYYRVGLRYAPRDLQLPARDAGFVVERRYEAVDDPTDVRRDPDGTWRIAAGARVRVRLQMVADGRRYHVALVDSLPAGLEPLNPALATTGSLPPDPTDDAADGWWWWRRTWYEHQNLRDERVEAFTSLLWSGVHDYDYVARATTPGVFVVPPPRAEEMYHPETFGRGRSDRVIVE
ncbi:MAG: hypothetical protein K0V04_17125 [Deltaproteobacteria bacterium]|nr:hypothetical protein [Deltaproteobacteria bacterium]